jgi:peptidoglycan hydrolase-like protein with peptidoglycan-binding domain
MSRNYLAKKSPEDLLNNFTDYRGLRYASNPEYEKVLRQQIGTINKHLSKYAPATLAPAKADPKMEAMVLQKKLKDAGYYKGKIDGIVGPKTKAAIANYQASQTPGPVSSLYNRSELNQVR